MGRSQNSFNKREKEKKKLQKRKEKAQRKEERKASSEESGKGLEDMMAYVDEFGNIIDSPPDPKGKKEVDASSIELGVPKVEKEDFTSRRRGKVNFFDADKGYGFIVQEGTQDRFFVHVNNLEGPIQEGDKVSFIAQKGQKGLDAVSVEVLK